MCVRSIRQLNLDRAKVGENFVKELGEALRLSSESQIVAARTALDLYPRAKNNEYRIWDKLYALDS